MSIQLTELAAGELRRVISEQEFNPEQMYLRVGIKGKGAQRQYTLDLEETAEPEDKIFESQGFNVACNSTDLAVLDETTIDFRRSNGGVAGFTFSVPEKEHTTHGSGEFTGPPPTEAQVRQALYKVNDPEVGVNIIDLGLLLELVVKDRDVQIRMTLTTPACPLEEHIRGEIDQRVRELCPGVDTIGVKIVWQPKWSSDLMTPEGKKQLGWSR